MYVVQEPAFLYRDRVRNIPTYLPTCILTPCQPILALSTLFAFAGNVVTKFFNGSGPPLIVTVGASGSGEVAVAFEEESPIANLDEEVNMTPDVELRKRR